MQTPSLGRIVIYRSRTGNYSMPAMIIATKDSLWKDGVEAGEVPPITEDTNVHLLCFTAGSGIQYQEFDVPYAGDDMNKSSTWHYPERIS